jgi:hypothetical protein
MVHAARCHIAAALAVLVLGGATADAKAPKQCICLAVMKEVTLTQAEQAAVSAHIKPCWGARTGPFDLLVSNTVVSLSPGVPVQLMVAPDGTVRDASVAPYNTSVLSDAAYRSFARLVYEAATNPRCASLPLPSAVLGQNETFTFQFTS